VALLDYALLAAPRQTSGRAEVEGCGAAIVARAQLAGGVISRLNEGTNGGYLVAARV